VLRAGGDRFRRIWFRRNPEDRQRTRPTTLAERLRHHLPVAIVSKSDTGRLQYKFSEETR
jgi:hypothetical protein